MEPWRGSALHGRPGVLWGPWSGRPSALTCSTLTRPEVSPPAASRPLAANQEYPLRAPGLRSGPAAPDAALPDGDMGFPPVPEAGSWRWRPVLLAFFLAASRGKVGEPGCGGGAPGEHSGQGRDHRSDGVSREPPSAPCDLPHPPTAERLLGLLGSGQQLSAKCPGWVIGTSVC